MVVDELHNLGHLDPGVVLLVAHMMGLPKAWVVVLCFLLHGDRVGVPVPTCPVRLDCLDRVAEHVVKNYRHRYYVLPRQYTRMLNEHVPWPIDHSVQCTNLKKDLPVRMIRMQQIDHNYFFVGSSLTCLAAWTAASACAVPPILRRQATILESKI